MKKLELVKVYGRLEKKIQKSKVNLVNAYVNRDTCQLGNEPWVRDDVRRGCDMADCDWLIRANPVLTRGSPDLAQFGLISKKLGIREDQTPDLLEWKCFHRNQLTG